MSVPELSPVPPVPPVPAEALPMLRLALSAARWERETISEIGRLIAAQNSVLAAGEALIAASEKGVT